MSVSSMRSLAWSPRWSVAAPVVNENEKGSDAGVGRSERRFALHVALRCVITRGPMKLPLRVSPPAARFASLFLLALPVAACSAVTSESAVSSSEALSATTTYLLPVEDDVREACRSTWTNQWCDATAAEAAGKACVATLVASHAHPACANKAAGCFQLLTRDTPCVANGPIYPTAASCDAPVERTCAFYSACLEADDACGASGYALGYGEKYCSRYDVETTFTPQGIVWRDAVLHCLQTALVPELPKVSSMTCDAVTTFAFDSHPRCYTEGPSICFLPISDIASVLATIDGKDLLSLRSAKQMASVAGTCVLQLTGLFERVDEPQTSARVPQEIRDRTTLGDRLRFWQDVEKRWRE